MSTAKRLYGKKFNPFAQEPQQNSSFFRSKVQRKINHEPDSHLGPGQYEISLPLVKPAFETIMKNANTVIVKFNSHCTNAFQSKSPRFKYHNEEHLEKDSSFKRFKNKRDQQNPQQEDSNHALERELSRTLLISQMQENKTLSPKISKRTKQQSEKIYRQNSTRRKSHMNTLSSKQQNIQKQQQQQMQHRTLPAASRLHNLQPNMIETKKLQSNRYNPTIKSTEWSKYKLKRKSFVDEILTDQQPGPGAYAVKEPKFRTYNQRAEITSWQFNSKTSRSPFDQTSLKQQVRNQFLSQSYRQSLPSSQRLVQDPAVKKMKAKILNKKWSRQKIFSLLKSKKEQISSTYIKPNFSLQFSAIHSRENLLVDAEE